MVVRLELEAVRLSRIADGTGAFRELFGEVARLVGLPAGRALYARKLEWRQDSGTDRKGIRSWPIQ